MNPKIRAFLRAAALGLTIGFGPLSALADNEDGAWSPLGDWPLIAVHAALTPDGRVLTYGTNGDGKQTGFFIYDVWDPSAGLGSGHMTLDNVTLTDLFCSSQVILPQSGEILIAGGDNWTGTRTTNTGNNNSNLFDFGDNSLARSQNMNRARWYSSATVLVNGEIYIQGGSGGGDRPEVREEDGDFRLLSDAPTGIYAQLFPRNFLAPDGRVFGYDTNGKMYFVDTDGTGSITGAGQINSSNVGWTSGAAMFEPGRILQIGGNSNGAVIVDINGPVPTVVATDPMSSKRQWVSATVLPNGHVLATGGSEQDNKLNGVNTSAEIWDPETGLWHVGSSGLKARLYHSSALLLPDATVLVAGGGAPGPQVNTNAEIYYPPYLYNTENELADRPAIVSAPSTVEVGDSFTIQVDSSISRVTLVKTGSVTHSVNMDQRFLELPMSDLGGGVLSVALPERASDTPPGYYLMFALDDNGVPSVGKMLRINIDTTPNVSVDYTPTIGGNGGGSFELACAIDETIVGVHGNYSTYVNQIGPQCVRIDQFGSWIGDPVDGALTGSTTSGTSFSLTCPVDHAISGFRGQAGDYVNQLDMQCRSLTPSGTLTGAATYLGATGGSGGTPQGPFSCGTDNPVYALYGRSGGWIDNFGVLCRPAPITPISVNSDPVIVNPGPQSTVLGVAVDLQIIATDGDDDDLTFTAGSLPDGLAIGNSDGRITGTTTAIGVFPVVVFVSDGTSVDAASFDWTVSNAALSLTPMPPQPHRLVSSDVSYTAETNGGSNVIYKWDFGDRTPETAYSSDPTVVHSFASPGIYLVRLTVSDDTGVPQTTTFIQGIYRPSTVNAPTHSGNIAFEVGASRVWAVNQDNASVTVLSAATNTFISEISVGIDPRGIAIAPDGRIWVTNKGSSTISIIDAASLTVVATVPLPFGSQPYGVAFSPTANEAFVVLEASGLLQKLDGTTGAELGAVATGPDVRHLAIDSTGSTVYVFRFVTPPQPGEETAVVETQIDGIDVGGELVAIDSVSMAALDTITLRHSDQPDVENAGSGVPNYLGAPSISPDGLSAVVPSKLDNIARGTLRDGLNLNFQNTVRAISSRIDLTTGLEDFDGRIDYDNASMASAIAHDPTGLHYFVALETSREVAVVDAYGGEEMFRINVGRAPQGVVVAPDGMTLYVNNFMDRTVGVYDLRNLQETGQYDAPLIANLNSVVIERLDPEVLLGKQLFYDAFDTRLARDRYMSCATCHNDGGQDGRVWDLTGMGEGLRNTISLRGTGAQHGFSHWSQNFDEIQDFEGQIRVLSGGTGLMADIDFVTGTRNLPLGDPKAGISADLDALAAYVESLTTYSPSPYRNEDGSLTADALAGKSVFIAEGCSSCHGGLEFTDSDDGTLHDIGTLKPSSGQRLNSPLTGIDTPTLRGVFATAPYLHDGSAATLADAVTAHDFVDLSGPELNSLVAYLQQIDSLEGFTEGLVAAYGFDSGVGGTVQDLSGNDNHGSIQGATWTAGQYGSALSFDGVDDRILVPASSSLDLGDEMTLSAWVRPDTAQSGWRTIVQRQVYQYFLLAGTGAGALRPGGGAVFGGGSPAYAPAPTPIPVDEWSHLAVTFNGSTLSVYVNGTVVVSGGISGTIPAVADPLWIGGNDPYGWYFNGLIDEVRVYNRALTVSEIANDMATPIGPPPPPDTEAPSVSIVAPTAGVSYETESATVTISGIATDNVSVSEVTWTNSAGGSGAASGTGSWSVAGIPLLEGSNLITVTAFDAAGNSSNDTLNVTYTIPVDVEAPTVSITVPTVVATYDTDSDSVAIGGSAADNVNVTEVVWSNSSTGGSGTASGTLGWSVDAIVLQEGLNLITVTAFDAAGNSSTDTLDVTYTPPPPDTEAPAVVIESPTASETYNAVVGTLNLGGTASDNLAVSLVTWSSSAGGSGTASGTDTWTVSAIVLREGSNLISITAFDEAGNSSTDTLDVLYAPPASPGLVAAYGFDEGAGATTTDASGNANDGVVQGATWTGGKFGGALSFDGVDDSVLIDSSASLNLGFEMTLEAWVMPNASQSGWRTVVQREMYDYFLTASSASGGLRPGGGGVIGGTAVYTPGPTLPVGEWTHLAITYNGTILTLFVNGTIVSSGAISGATPPSSRPLWIGGNGPLGWYFNGLIDDIRVYNRALAQSEIQVDMATPVTP